LDDCAEGSGGSELNSGRQFINHRFAAAHVIEARIVGFGVRDQINRDFEPITSITSLARSLMVISSVLRR